MRELPRDRTGEREVLAEAVGKGFSPKPIDQPKYGVTVVQNDNGDVIVLEHDVATGKSRKAATFHAARRKVTVNEGKDEAVQDVAQIRAMIYAQTVELLVNEGTVDLGIE